MTIRKAIDSDSDAICGFFAFFIFHFPFPWGFSIVGTLPKAFNHPELGLVDLFVMHRLI